MAVCCCHPREGEEEPIKNAMTPTEDRKCRDVLCCLFFAIYWLGMILVAIVGKERGNPETLIYGRDFAKRTCGIDEDVKELPNTFYPRISEDIYYATTNEMSLSSLQFFSICVKDCPKVQEKVNSTYGGETTTFTSSLSTKSILNRCLPSGETNTRVLDTVCLDPIGAEPNCTVSLFMAKQCDQICKSVNVTTENWSTSAVEPDPITPQLQTTAAVFGRLFGDVKKSALTILLVGGLGSFLFGVLWIFFLGYFAKLIVWITCLLVLVLLLILSLFCSIQGETITNSHVLSYVDTVTTLKDVTDSTKQQQFAAASYVSWLVTAIVFLLILAMRKRIQIAIAIIKEASRSLRYIPTLLVWPIVPTLAVLGLAIYWLLLSLFLLTADSFSFKDISNMAPTAVNLTAMANMSDVSAANSTSVGVGPVNVSISTQNILFLYHLFGFLWTNQLFQAISICTISGSIAEYYWSLPDQFGQRPLSAFPVASSLHRTLRYHIGSLCFGSLVVAIVQFLRIIMQYIDQNTKSLQQSNGLIKVVFKMVQCCLWCFEKCLKFISSNAYILIAMKGTSFCSASMNAFVLILANAARVATINTITFFVLLLVKLTIVVAISLIVFMILLPTSPLAALYTALEGDGEGVTSPIAPVLITGIIAYFVSSILLNLYDMTIDTLLLCFCEDAKMNDQKASPYMSPELQDIMGGEVAKKKESIKVSPREE